MCRSLGPVVIERCCVAPSEVVSPVCALVERRAEVGQFCQVCRGKRLWLSARVQDEQAEPRESVDADRLQHRLLHGASDAGEAVTSKHDNRRDVAALPLIRHDFYGNWNYTINPAAPGKP